MKSQILKIGVVLLLIVTLTMANFIFVGQSFISFAADSVSTNDKNIEFSAYFEDSGGSSKGSSTDKEYNDEDFYLHIQVKVAKEGYFNGEISLSDSNFKLISSDSSYVNKVEENKITLNQINAGETADIRVKIEPIENEDFDIGLLSSTSKLKLSGTYKTHKNDDEIDVDISATRELKLNFTESNNEQSIVNDLQVITNKIVKIDGEEKRLVQYSWNMGLKDNNYPMNTIEAKLTIPEIDGKQAEVKAVSYLNNMTSFDYDYTNSIVTFSLKNDTKDNKVSWKKDGNENVILSCIYDKDTDLVNQQATAEETVTLYGGKAITQTSRITLTAEEKDEIIQASIKNSEDTMYKGKIHSGIDRQYASLVDVKINNASVPEYIQIKENTPAFVADENTLAQANVVYNETMIAKTQFDELFGENGSITIYNENNVQVGVINKDTPADEGGNLVVTFAEGQEPKSITLRTTSPIAEGEMKIRSIRTIKASDAEAVANATALNTKVDVEYNMEESADYSKGTTQEVESNINLENTVTKAKLEVNKSTLSTVIANNVEIKAILVSNDEQYDLYRDPHIVIQLPEQVQNITINSVNMLYEDELTVSDYSVNGRNIQISLSGEQTSYKDKTIEGAQLVINADITLDNKSATQDTQITMAYNNQNAIMYENNQTAGITTQPIRIVAPKDMTTINSISDLGVETIGQEESTDVKVERGQAAKQVSSQIEIINNNENAVENVKVLGNLPTNNSTNNMNIEMNSGITVEGTDGATVYYTENENATDDLNDAQNGWTESIENLSDAKKYLITIDNMDAQTSVQGNYQMTIPANLEYNQNSSTGYTVAYTNAETKQNTSLNSTEINLQTGVGPVAEAELTATVGGEAIDGTVKNGEVIRYTVKVTNTGSEDITNLQVTGQVPEGTVMVEPEEYYEYTGSVYYKELDATTYQSTIESLKQGETATCEYEVRVKNDTAAGTTLSNIAEIKYGDVTKQSAENTATVENGNLRVTIKRTSDRTQKAYPNTVIDYYVIVENISDTAQNNVVVRPNLSDNLNVQTALLLLNIPELEYTDGDLVYIPDTKPDVDSSITDEIPDDAEQNPSEELPEIEETEIEYSSEINLGTIAAGENKTLELKTVYGENENPSKDITVSAVASDGQENYVSNLWEEEGQLFDLALSMTATPTSQYVKSGDQIEYTIRVQNSSDADAQGVTLKDSVPQALTINSVTVDGEAVDFYSNDFTYEIATPANSTQTIVINTTIDYSETRTEAEAITNVATLEEFGEVTDTSPEITHIIQADVSPDDNNGNGGNGPGTSGSGSATKAISGSAWYDENADGVKNNGEQAISNVKVQLVNTETDNLAQNTQGETLEATTNDNGIYVIDGVPVGSYIAIFDFDQTRYALTQYKASGAAESQNSDVMMNQLTIGGQTSQVASTDIINVSDSNISNIDIGLIERQNFDLKLDKYVSRIIVQDANGTTTQNYNNETLAKMELNAKTVNGATVLIEYKIVVTNNGDVDGYVRSVADYMPSELKFSSELNSDWYQSGGTLYNTSLANQVLSPGQTATLTLTLTKSMTGEDTGRFNNRAEIAEAYNELGLNDGNSTPGNQASGENDMGSADVLLSIKTGGAVYITIGVIIVVIALAIAAVIIIKKKRKIKE